MPKSKQKPVPTPDALRALVVGGGGREHALAWRLHRSPSCKALYTTHASNPGIKAIAKPLGFDYSTAELYRVEQAIRAENINLVVVGPEQPLADGITDKLAKTCDETGCVVFGPTAGGAQIEADKAWAKRLMRAAAVPTAEARVFKDARGAIEYLESREYAHVVKASGLAAGKGVFVPDSLQDAIDAVHQIADPARFGDAGSEIIIEEKLEGPEVSVFALTDGRNIAILDVCQDHKRLGEGDTGPNTGGMGAYCPVPDAIFNHDHMADVARQILVPAIDGLKREGIEYRGVLYAGLMLTPAGPKVLEFNCRFGDPEAQCLVRRAEGDFAKLLHATAAGNLDTADYATADHAVVCVVLAAEGYPDAPVKGTEITGIEDAEALEGVTVFHAGTERRSGKLLTAGGRVLSVTAAAPTVAEARDRALAAADLIHMPGKQLRRDIAHQAVATPANSN